MIGHGFCVLFLYIVEEFVHSFAIVLLIKKMSFRDCLDLRIVLGGRFSGYDGWLSVWDYFQYIGSQASYE